MLYLLCQTTASVLCWTGASFCPEFKICKEKTEDRVPAFPCSNQQVMYSGAPHQARNTNSHRGQCSQRSPLAAADSRAHHTCSVPEAGSHRHCHGSRVFRVSQVHLPSSARGIGCGVWGSVQEHGNTDLLWHACAAVHNRVKVSLALAEEMGKTRNSKH